MRSPQSTSEKKENTKPEVLAAAVPPLELEGSHTTGVVAFAITKSEAIKRMTAIARRAGLDYEAITSLEVVH